MVIWVARKAVMQSRLRYREYERKDTGGGRRQIRQFNFQLRADVVHMVSFYSGLPLCPVRQEKSELSVVPFRRSYRWEISFA